MKVIEENEGVIYVDNLPGSAPIAGYLETKEIIISLADWEKYTPSEQLAMYYHEQGHFINQSVDEFEADLIGFLIFIKSGNTDYDATVTFMEKLFNENNSEQMKRLEIQKKRLAEFKKSGKTIVSSAGSTSDLMGGGFFKEPEKVSAGGEAAIVSSAAPYVPSTVEKLFSGIDNLLFGRKNKKDARKANQDILEAQKAMQRENTKQLEFEWAAKVGIYSNIAYAVVAVAVVALMIYLLKPKN